MVVQVGWVCLRLFSPCWIASRSVLKKKPPLQPRPKNTSEISRRCCCGPKDDEGNNTQSHIYKRRKNITEKNPGRILFDSNRHLGAAAAHSALSKWWHKMSTFFFSRSIKQSCKQFRIPWSHFSLPASQLHSIQRLTPPRRTSYACIDSRGVWMQ